VADNALANPTCTPGCGFGGVEPFPRDCDEPGLSLQGSGMQAQFGWMKVLRIMIARKRVLFAQLWRHYGTELRGRRVALMGRGLQGLNRPVSITPRIEID